MTFSQDCLGTLRHIEQQTKAEELPSLIRFGAMLNPFRGTTARRFQQAYSHLVSALTTSSKSSMKRAVVGPIERYCLSSTLLTGDIPTTLFVTNISFAVLSISIGNDASVASNPFRLAISKTTALV